ncbi:MAG: TonB-dependent receptor plug domain-containing protein [Deltaproteobacteria bacterium]|nr:TonB-dependent receptor plug domain-containing protein [Deltaproteobacteria bacterium]
MLAFFLGLAFAALVHGEVDPSSSTLAQSMPHASTSTVDPVGTTASTRVTGLIRARALERGTKQPIPFAAVFLSDAIEERSEVTDVDGRFEVIARGDTETILEISAPGFELFRQTETIAGGEALEVDYLLVPKLRNPYEVVVTGRRDRAEISRTRIDGRELTQIPGTFGDPFRVIATLPGASQPMSLLPYPVVRGSSPGNTGFLIDGIRVPLLFHLLTGPSVIHPQMIDEVEFYPGDFPVQFGGYTGGIVNGRTRAAEPDETRAEVDASLFEVGGFARGSLVGGTGTLAGRYGFPGLLISLASPRVDLQYFDYQARFDFNRSKGAREGTSVVAFGAFDGLDTVPAGLPDESDKEPALHLQFHRVDLRQTHTSSTVSGTHQLTFGLDRSLALGDGELASSAVELRSRLSIGMLEGLELGLGLDGLLRKGELSGAGSEETDLTELLGEGGEPSDLLLTGGALAELVLGAGGGFQLRPGARVDVYSDAVVAHVGVDPRVSGRLRVRESPELWVEAGLGIFHQPPRFTIPLPGLDQIAFEQGLLESTQATLGLSARLIGLTLDVDAYFNWMDPIFYDLAINPADVTQPEPEAPPGQAPPTPPRRNTSLDDRLGELLVPATGRGYGIEILLRRQSVTGISGWVAYTLSRSERFRQDEWVAFDFDRTHILNAVLSVPLPRRWQLGLRAQVSSGRPLTTTAGLSRARTDPFVRFDLRVDKTAVWRDWLLDFYVDVANLTLSAEELTPQESLRYVLPTVGFRAIL